MPRLVATAFAGLALLFAGCDNNTTTPTSPSTGSLQVTTARSTLRAGETTQLVVTTSAGTPVTGVAWTSSDNSVLTVSATGLATAGRAGRVTISAGSPSGSGSIAMRVVHDYQGTWTGGISRPQITCSATSTASFCAPGAVTSGTVTLTIVQIGDQLTGTLIDSAEPSAPVPLIGSVQTDDAAALSGRLDTPTTSPTRRVEVTALRATPDVTIGSLSGSYQLLVDRASTAGTLLADYRAQTQFRDLRR
ncbi:Ig-like domain-containing protein [Luteitalea sp.]